MAAIIDYSEGTTCFHRANPVSKIVFAVCVCVAAFLAQGYPALVGILAFVTLVGIYTGLGRRTLSLLGAFVGVGLVMVLIQTLIVRDGDQVFLWITTGGLDVGFHAALRLATFALPLMLMLTLTRLTDLTNALVEVVHLPYRYAFTITTAFRFVPIFSREMDQIMEAQTARGVEFDTKNPIRRMRLMLPLVAPLLISSVARADDTALAAEERGFYLRTRESSYKRYPFGTADVPVLAMAVAVVVVGALF